MMRSRKCHPAQGNFNPAKAAVSYVVKTGCKYGLAGSLGGIIGGIVGNCFAGAVATLYSRPIVIVAICIIALLVINKNAMQLMRSSRIASLPAMTELTVVFVVAAIWLLSTSAAGLLGEMVAGAFIGAVVGVAIGLGKGLRGRTNRTTATNRQPQTNSKPKSNG